MPVSTTFGKTKPAIALRLLCIVCAALFVVNTAPPVNAAGPLCGLGYDALPAPVTRPIDASTTILHFGVATALAAGDVIRVTFPAGTTFPTLATSDFLIRQVNSPAGVCAAGSAGGTDTAPTAVAVAPVPVTGVPCSIVAPPASPALPASGSGCPTLDFTFAAASRSANGMGQVVIATSPTGGGKVHQPPTHDPSNVLAVETRSGGAVKDGPLSISGPQVDVSLAPDWAQLHQNAAHTGLAPRTDLKPAAFSALQTLALTTGTGNQPQKSTAIVADFDGDGKLDVAVGTSVGGASPSPQMGILMFHRTGGPGTALSLWRTILLPTAGTCGTGQGTTNNGWINMAAGDMDMDGLPDIVASFNYVTDGTVLGSGVTCNDSKFVVYKGTTGGALFGPVAGNGTPGSCTGPSIVFAYDAPVVGDIDGIPGNEAVFPYFVGGTANTAMALALHWNGAGIVCAWDSPMTAVAAAANLRVQTGPVLAKVRPSQGAHQGLDLFIGRDDGNTVGALFLCFPTPSQVTTGGANVYANCETHATNSGIRGLAVADMDQDGTPDLVAAGREDAGASPVNTGALAVFKGSDLFNNLGLATRYDAPGAGSASFGASGAGTDFEWTIPTMADYKGDGTAEATVVNYSEFTGDTFTIGNVDERSFNGAAVTCPGPPCQWARTAGGTPTSNPESRGGGIAVDLQGDARPEFVFASNDGNLIGTSFAAGTGAISAAPFLNVAYTGATLMAPPVAADVRGDCRTQLLEGDSLGNFIVTGDVAAPATVPAAVANLMGVPTGDPAYSNVADQRVTLSWSAPATGGAPITAYKIYRSTASGFVPAPTNLLTTLLAPVLPSARFAAGAYTAPPTTFTDTGVSKTSPAGIGTRYYYKVAATNCMGEATPSNEARVDVVVPAPVTNLRAMPDGDPAYPLYVRTGGAVPAASDTIYAGGGPTVTIGAYRFTRFGTGAGCPNNCPAGTTVAASDADVGTTLNTAFPLLRVDIAPAGFGASDTLYADLDGTGSVTVGDFRYTGAPGFPAGSTVGIGNSDLGSPVAGSLQVRLTWTAPDVTTTFPTNANYNLNCAWLEGYRIYRTTTAGPDATAPVFTIAPGTPPVAWPRTIPAALTVLSDPKGAGLGMPAPGIAFTDYSVLRGNTYAYTAKPVNCVGEGTGTTVSADVNTPAAPTLTTTTPSGVPAYAAYRRVDQGIPGPTLDDAIYLGGGTSVAVGAFRFTDPDGAIGPLQAGTTVRSTDADAYPIAATFSNAFAIIRVDRAPAGPGTEDAIYGDLDGNGGVSAGDYRFTDPDGAGPLAAGTTVLPGATDIGTATAPADQVQLEWTASATIQGCAGGAPPGPWLEGFRIYRTTAPTAVTQVPANLLVTLPNPPGWPRALAPSPPAIAPAVTFLDSGAIPGFPLSPDNTYNYAVAAINCVGEGPPSAPASADLHLPTTPTLTATQGAVPSGDPAYSSVANEKKVTLTWTAATPNNANCNWLEGYQIYRGTTSGGETLYATVRPSAASTPALAPGWRTTAAWGNPSPPALPTTFVDSGVSAGNTYYYKVSAVNCAGEQRTLSAERSVDVNVPAAPTFGGGQGAIVSGQPAYAAPLQVKLSWTPPPAPSFHGCDAPVFTGPWLEGFRIYRTTGATPVTLVPANLLVTITSGASALSPPAAAPWTKPVPPTPPSPVVSAVSYVDTAVALGNTYNYAITAVNCVGESALSATTSADVRVPNAPTGLTAPSGTNVVLGWTAPVDPNVHGCGAPAYAGTWLEGYRIYRSTVSGFTPGPGNLLVTITSGAAPLSPPAAAPWTKALPPTAPSPAVAATSFTDSSVSSPNVYYYVISAINCAGESQPSAQFQMGPNAAPSFVAPAAQTAYEGTTLTFSAANGNALSVADADAGTNPVKASLSLPGGDGTLTLAGTAGLSFVCGSTPSPNVIASCTGTGTGDTTMIFTGTIAQINTALASVVYTPPADTCGPTHFFLTLAINDGGNSGYGGPKDNFAAGSFKKVDLNIRCINHVPIFTATDPAQVDVNMPLQTVSPWATGIAPAGPSEPDEASQNLAFTTTVTQLTNGLTFTSQPLVSKGTVGAATPGVFYGGPFTTANGWGILTFQAAAGKTGTATINVCLWDDGGKPNAPLTLDVDHVCADFVITIGHPLVAYADTANLLENTPFSLAAPGVLQNDAWPGGHAHTAVLQSSPTHAAAGSFALAPDGSFTYTPDTNYVGSDSFTYLVHDSTDPGDSNTVTVSINVAAVNEPPTFIDAGVAPARGRHVADEPVTMLAWAHDVTLGIGADDANQQVKFVTTYVAGSPSLFAVAPSISPTAYSASPTGDLTYTIAGGQCGTATYAVVATDDGVMTPGPNLPPASSTPHTLVINVDCIIYTGPAANFVANPSTAFAQSPVQFVDVTTDGDGTVQTWHWDFGDGSTADTQMAQHVYAFGGSFSVSLTVADNHLVSSTTSRVILVRVPASVGTAAGSGSRPPPAATAAPAAAPQTPSPDAGTGAGQLPATGSSGTGAGGGAGGIPAGGTSSGSGGGTPNLNRNDVGFTVTAVAGQPLTYSFQANDGTATNSWDFGDGSSPVAGPQTTHTFPAAGSYSVQLTQTASDGSHTSFPRTVMAQSTSPALSEVSSAPVASSSAFAWTIGGAVVLLAALAGLLLVRIGRAKPG
jgi:PKD repeat protein